jgi:predicted ribosome quality control (RQC) complex YloA/Tae2 family protein
VAPVLTLRELRHVARVLETRVGARVDRLSQPDPAELVLQLSGGRDRPGSDRGLYLFSCRPRVARVSELEEPRPALPKPPAFAQYLRAHVEGARVAEIRVEGNDRQLLLRFEGHDTPHALLLSILGPRSNLYALGAGDRLVASARPLAETRRDLALGEPWRSPESGAPREGEDRFAAVPDGELLRAIESHYAEAEARGAEDALARRIASALRKQRASLEKKLRLCDEDLAAAGEAERLATQGELLKASLREVKAGQATFVARDFASGAEVEIALDPKLTPSANLDEIFRRARRAEKRARKAEAEREEARERLAALDALTAEASAAAAAGPEALAAFAAREEIARLLDRFAPAPREAAEPAPEKKAWRIGRTELPTRLVPKRYRTSDGLEVWVGKNDEGNDVLTMKLARGNDLFFHLEGNPGSHVVLRTEGRQDPPQESLLEAAELAVQFSKAKHATRAAVHVAHCKDISKPKGAKPGLVYVHRGRTIQLRRDAKRLARILEARVDE